MRFVPIKSRETSRPYDGRLGSLSRLSVRRGNGYESRVHSDSVRATEGRRGPSRKRTVAPAPCQASHRARWPHTGGRRSRLTVPLELRGVGGPAGLEVQLHATVLRLSEVVERTRTGSCKPTPLRIRERRSSPWDDASRRPHRPQERVPTPYAATRASRQSIP